MTNLPCTERGMRRSGIGCFHGRAAGALGLLALLATLLLSSLARADCEPSKPRVEVDGRRFSVTFCTDAREGKQCDSGCYAGVTLRRAKDAFHFDLPVKEVSHADVEKPITLSAEIEPGFVEFLVALWGTKNACTQGPDARHGCKTYGYVLEEVVWSFPGHGYWGGPSGFAPILPAKVKLLDAGGGAKLIRKAKRALRGHKVVPGGRAKTPRSHVEILYRAKWDRGAAWGIAGKLRKVGVGIRWDVAHWPEAPEAFVVAIGKDKGE